MSKNVLTGGLLVLPAPLIATLSAGSILKLSPLFASEKVIKSAVCTFIQYRYEMAPLTCSEHTFWCQRSKMERIWVSHEIVGLLWRKQTVLQR